MKLYLYSVVAAGLVTFKTLAVDPTAMTLRSTENRTALLELYTSEGCSSCPPAEGWLSRLKQSPGLWRDFVPVAFHVDYWDYLGWRDPWGSKDFSKRQSAYAAGWNSSSVYTPGFVLNGAEWSAWRAGGGVSNSKEITGILLATSADTRHWQIEFRPANAAAKYEVYAARLASGLYSQVGAGENSGRRLDHDFIALSLVRTQMVIQNGTLHAELVLPARVNGAPGRDGIAIWVSVAGRLEPVQTVGGWLGPVAAK